MNNEGLAQRRNRRIPGYDYGTNGAYFITICTKDRKRLLWRRRDDPCGRPEPPSLSALGMIAKETISEIESRFPVSVDCYAIMAEHIHLVLRLGQDDTSANVSRIVGAYKSLISYRWREYCRERERGATGIWQSSFYDHVIRNDQDYLETCQYVLNNPKKWEMLHENDGQP